MYLVQYYKRHVKSCVAECIHARFLTLMITPFNVRVLASHTSSIILCVGTKLWARRWKSICLKCTWGGASPCSECKDPCCSYGLRVHLTTEGMDSWWAKSFTLPVSVRFVYNFSSLSPCNWLPLFCSLLRQLIFACAFALSSPAFATINFTMCICLWHMLTTHTI